MVKPKKRKPGPGRGHKAKIDLGIVEGAAAMAATDAEIAGALGVSRECFVTRRKAEPEIAAACEKGRAKGDLTIRRKQWDVGVRQGHPTMLIWLGKQRLGQRDKFEHTVSEARDVTSMTDAELEEIIREGGKRQG